MNKGAALKAIEGVTENRFAELRNGKVTFVSSGEPIPSDLIRHPPSVDDFYLLSASTCGGSNGCAIGAPLTACDGYSPDKCGTYTLDNIKYASMKIEQVLELLRG